MHPRSAPTPPPFRSLAPAIAVALVLAASLIVAGLSMAIYNDNLGKAEKLRDVTVQANILAGSVTAALAFDDAGPAQEYIDALRANRDIDAAGVYDLGGKLIAGFGRLRDRPPAANIVVTRPVTQDGARLGSVYLRTVREPFARRAARYGGIGLLVLMAALVVVVLGASNASLGEAHRKLKSEMTEREKTEHALSLSRELEAAAQIEIAAQRNRAALRQSERQLEFALHAGRLGSWATHLESGKLTGSEFFRANFGLGPDVALERVEDLQPYIHPDDREALSRALARVIEDGTDLECEYRTTAPDGAERWILIRGQAVYANDGTAQEMTGVSLDITGRKVAEQRQRLLLDELNHRVKNTLATVQSIAKQTWRDTQDAVLFEQAFLARLAALARVHDLLSRLSWEGASLTEIVRQTLAPHLTGGGPDGRWSLAGPEVRLGPNAAVTLAMAFHELATNAAKYGALSAEGGRVEVMWNVDNLDAATLIEINWRELGGPSVVPPLRRGFGSRFLERGLAREFDGSVKLDFAVEGVCCRMALPLSSKLRMAA